MHANSRALFSVLTVSEVGHGVKYFVLLGLQTAWEVSGISCTSCVCSIILTSLQLAIGVPGFASQLLMRCIKGDLTVAVLVDFLQLIVAEVVLQPGILDDHKWLTEAGGVLSTKSAYKSFTSFVELQPWRCID